MSALTAISPILALVYLALIVYGLTLAARFVRAVEKIAEGMNR